MLVDFLCSRPDEASVIVRFLDLTEVASLQAVSRKMRAWARQTMRNMIGHDGRIPCGTAGLTLDVVNMRFEGGIDPHDRGDVFFTGLCTQNAKGEACRLLVRMRPGDMRYNFCWDRFAEAAKNQNLLARSTRTPVLRPLVLPWVRNASRGIMLLSPLGHQHDFVANKDLAGMIDTSSPPSVPHLQDFYALMHHTDRNDAWDKHARRAGLYETALYVPELQGVVYGLQGLLSFLPYDPIKGFHGAVVALPLAHSLSLDLVPIACTYAYEPVAGLLYVVGGKLHSGRKSCAIYSFPLRAYLWLVKQHFACNNNTAMSEFGPVPKWLDDRNQLRTPGLAYLFKRVGSLAHARAWCHVRFVNKGRVMLVWGGKGKFEKHPSAIEVFFKGRRMRTQLACPDNVIW